METKICNVNYIGYVPNQGNTWKTDCNRSLIVETHSEMVDGEFVQDIPYPPFNGYDYNYCPFCGGELKIHEVI